MSRGPTASSRLWITADDNRTMVVGHRSAAGEVGNLFGDSPDETEALVGAPEAVGLIYTELEDMPSLSALLAQHRVRSAVWEREVKAQRQTLRVSARRWVAATMVASVPAVVGASMLVLAALSPSEPDPYLGLLLFLGGVGLVVTLLLQTARQEGSG